MNSENRTRLKKTCWQQRKRLNTLFLSVAFMGVPSASSVFGESPTLCYPASAESQPGQASILKLVGIRFVDDHARKSIAATTVSAVVDESKVSSSDTPATIAIASSRAMASTSTTTLLVKPTLLAALGHDIDPPSSPEIGTVKINMPVNSDRSKTIALQMPTIGSLDQPKIVKQTLTESRSDFETMRPVALEETPTLASERPAAFAIPTETDSRSANDDAKDSLTTTSPLTLVKSAPSPDSRIPTVVRIPSMTLAKTISISMPIDTLEATEEKSKDVERPTVKNVPPILNENVTVKNNTVNNNTVNNNTVNNNSVKDNSDENNRDENIAEIDPRRRATEEDRQLADEFSAAPIAQQKQVREASRAEPKFVALPASVIQYQNEPGNIEESQVEDGKQQKDTAGFPKPGQLNTVVEFARRSVHKLDLTGSVERVSVDDDSICKALISETNEIMLLGVGQGSTKLKVWLVSGATVNQPPKVIDIIVHESWTTATHASSISLSEATKTIADLFPSSKIAIKPLENGSLTVFGTVNSNEQAKQVAALVRKMFLVPVQDRIAVSTP